MLLMIFWSRLNIIKGRGLYKILSPIGTCFSYFFFIFKERNAVFVWYMKYWNLPHWLIGCAFDIDIRSNNPIKTQTFSILHLTLSFLYLYLDSWHKSISLDFIVSASQLPKRQFYSYTIIPSTNLKPGFKSYSGCETKGLYSKRIV